MANNHFGKIVRNTYRRKNALFRQELLSHDKLQDKKSYLTKWERYRETKIDMVAFYIKLLKKKAYVKRIIILLTLRMAYKMNNAQVMSRKSNLKHLISGIMIAIKTKTALKKRDKKFGKDFDHRMRNVLRQ